MVWKGGLASYGGVIGIIFVFWIFFCFELKCFVFWVLDKVVVFIVFVGCFICLGNLMNFEIVGKFIDVVWGFKFFCNEINFWEKCLACIECVG